MRSGNFFACNDLLIREFVNDPNYQIKENGSIFRLVKNVWRETGKALTRKNGMQYRHLQYKKHNLLVHRIVYAKFSNRIQSDLVINHKDGNALNNHISNLELVSQSTNMLHCKAK